MGSGYQNLSPLSKADMEAVLDDLGLSERDKKMIVMVEGLFGGPCIPMKQVCKKFKISCSRGADIKKNAFEKMARVKLKKEILECVKMGKSTSGLGKKASSNG